MARCKRTGKRAATAAAKVLRGEVTQRNALAAAGSALSQRQHRKHSK